VSGLPTIFFHTIFGESFDVLESAIKRPFGGGAIAIGQKDAFVFDKRPTGGVGLDFVDIRVDRSAAALTTPKEPATVSKLLDEMSLMGVGGLIVVDEAGDESVKVFEAFALDDESFGTEVMNGGVTAGGEFTGRCGWPCLIRHKISFQGQFQMGACGGNGFLAVSG
jgi:hypothetical protein